ncbi:MAG TPA: hypothetical protein VFH27_00320, partial [Longimicrobiaceae bacterium]|nr:hypothetical protein [Longimicrobiaceae bacterium]
EAVERLDLAQLAREGEASRVRAAAAQAHDERMDRIRQRRQVRRLGHGNLLNALSDNPFLGGRSLLVWMLAATAVCGALWMGAEWMEGPPLLRNVGLGGTILLPVLYFPLRRLRGLRSLRVERTWLHDLPFPVRGYFALLASSPEEDRTVRVRFRLADEGPGEEIIRGLAGRSGGAVTVTRSGGAWEIESGTIHSYAGGDTDPDNGPLLWWMRSVIADTLLPLHMEHRVTSVRFRG